MNRTEWLELLDRLTNQLETLQEWEPASPNLMAVRCEQSRHRTLAHLRACQEQWFAVVTSFADRQAPSVTILHPWRHFEAGNYASVPWEMHMEKFVEDRKLWLALRDSMDFERGGKWNRKPDTIGGLTRRLADHESHHMSILR